MRVIISPNSMKGSIDACDFADAIQEGLYEAGITNVLKIPMADGGDGTAKILSSYYHADFFPVSVDDPLSRKIASGFYIDHHQTALIEMADASGLKLLKPDEYSSTKTTSIGTGQLIKSAIRSGATTIMVGLGGSATVDGGMGALMALGVKFFSREGEITIGCGYTMGDIIFIDPSEAIHLLKDIKLLFLTDVKNQLLGRLGAARIFGPQKGATSSEVEMLEKNLSLFTGALFQTTGRDISTIIGGGAAGGIGASFHALFNAEIIDGATFILEKTGFEKIAYDADVIITGEGKIDETTFMGKIPGEILRIGKKIGKPVYAICGVKNDKSTNGFTEVLSLSNEGVDEAESIEMAFSLIKRVTSDLAKRIR